MEDGGGLAGAGAAGQDKKTGYQGLADGLGLAGVGPILRGQLLGPGGQFGLHSGGRGGLGLAEVAAQVLEQLGFGLVDGAVVEKAAVAVLNQDQGRVAWGGQAMAGQDLGQCVGLGELGQFQVDGFGMLPPAFRQMVERQTEVALVVGLGQQAEEGQDGGALCVGQGAAVGQQGLGTQQLVVGEAQAGPGLGPGLMDGLTVGGVEHVGDGCELDFS